MDWSDFAVILIVHQYLLPKGNDLLVTLPGGKKFMKLDFTQAYLQLALHPESKGIAR